jgi:hypothetical protein
MKKEASMSNKREAFVRLASKRTNNVIASIRILSNCGNTYAYEYTEDDVKEIFAAIDKEIKLAKARFETKERKDFALGE